MEGIFSCTEAGEILLYTGTDEERTAVNPLFYDLYEQALQVVVEYFVSIQESA